MTYSPYGTVPPIIGPQRAPIEVTVTTHSTCWESHHHKLDLIAYVWPPSGTWHHYCAACATEHATKDLHPMRGYEPCEQHWCNMQECIPEHREVAA